MTIAWSHLTLIQQAQLLHLRPDLTFERDLAMGNFPKCPRANCGGSIMPNDEGKLECLLCNRTFDKQGNEIKPIVGIISHKGMAFHRI